MYCAGVGKSHGVKVTQFMVILIAVASTASSQCIELKHSSSALVDCENKCAKIFALPFCENALIATFKNIDDVDVAALYSMSFLNLLHTACDQRITEVGIAEDDWRPAALSSAAAQHVIDSSAQVFPLSVSNDFSRIPLLSRVLATLPLHPTVSCALSKQDSKAFPDIFTQKSIKHLSFAPDDVRHHADLFPPYERPLRRSLNSNSSSYGCSLSVNKSVESSDDDGGMNNNATTLQNTGEYCSYANLTEIGPGLLPSTTVYL